MAGLKLQAQKNNITSGVATKTLLQILAPTNQRFRVLEVSIGFEGTVNTNQPVEVWMARQSSAGTMSALTPIPIDDDLTETPQATCQHTATAEPTTGNICGGTWAVHPQTGLVYQVPKSDEIMIKGAGRLGLLILAPNTVQTDAYIKYEE